MTMNTATPNPPSYTPSINLITDCAFQRFPAVVKELINYIRYRHLDLEYSLNREYIGGPCPVHDGYNRNEFAIHLETGAWFCNSLCNRGNGTARLLQRVLRSRERARHLH